MKDIRLLGMLCFVILLSAAVASAQTVSSLVTGNNAGTVTSDPQGPSSSTVTSYLTFSGTATIDFAADGFGRAAQSPDGSGAVLADALFVNGQAGNSVEARSTWTKSATNTSSVPVDYVFGFVITPPSLRIADYAFLEDTDPQRPDISFEATIHVDGAPLFETGAHLIGGTLSHVLNENGTSLNPSFVSAGSVFGYDFQGYSGSLTLGPVAAGDSVTVTYEMIARVETPGYEAGGRAQFGDPFDLQGSPGFSGVLEPAGLVAIETSTWHGVKKLYR